MKQIPKGPDCIALYLKGKKKKKKAPTKVFWLLAYGQSLCPACYMIMHRVNKEPIWNQAGVFSDVT